MTSRPAVLLALALAVWVAARYFAGPPARTCAGALAGPVPWPLDSHGNVRASTARAQLARADHRRSVLRGCRDGERESLRSDAIRAYRGVRESFPEASREVALAAMRAGRLAAAGGDLDLAAGELALAAKRAAGTPLEGVARLEHAHVLRRAGRPLAALQAYDGALLAQATTPRDRDSAWFWKGRVAEVVGRDDEARRAWATLAEGDADPPLRVQACDRLARSWILADDADEAARILAVCEERLAPYAAEATELGERTRSAIARMLAPRWLEARRGPLGVRPAGAPLDGAADISERED